MIRRNVTLPEIGLIAGTRAALGAGIGLLLADRLSNDQRRAVGWTLLAVGALTTIPLVANLIGREPAETSGKPREFESKSPREDMVSLQV
jgi:uncharacterized membrane protein YfcA